MNVERLVETGTRFAERMLSDIAAGTGSFSERQLSRAQKVFRKLGWGSKNPTASEVLNSLSTRYGDTVIELMGRSEKLGEHLANYHTSGGVNFIGAANNSFFLKSTAKTSVGGLPNFGGFFARSMMGAAAGGMVGQLRGDNFGATVGDMFIGGMIAGPGGAALRRMPGIRKLGGLSFKEGINDLSKGMRNTFIERVGFGHGVSPHMYSALGLGFGGMITGGMVGHPWVGAIAGATAGFSFGNRMPVDKLKIAREEAQAARKAAKDKALAAARAIKDQKVNSKATNHVPSAGNSS